MPGSEIDDTLLRFFACQQILAAKSSPSAAIVYSVVNTVNVTNTWAALFMAANIDSSVLASWTPALIIKAVDNTYNTKFNKNVINELMNLNAIQEILDDSGFGTGAFQYSTSCYANEATLLKAIADAYGSSFPPAGSLNLLSIPDAWATINCDGLSTARKLNIVSIFIFYYTTSGSFYTAVNTTSVANINATAITANTQVTINNGVINAVNAVSLLLGGISAEYAAKFTNQALLAAGKLTGAIKSAYGTTISGVKTLVDAFVEATDVRMARSNFGTDANNDKLLFKVLYKLAYTSSQLLNESVITNLMSASVQAANDFTFVYGNQLLDASLVDRLAKFASPTTRVDASRDYLKSTDLEYNIFTTILGNASRFNAIAPLSQSSTVHGTVNTSELTTIAIIKTIVGWSGSNTNSNTFGAKALVYKNFINDTFPISKYVLYYHVDRYNDIVDKDINGLPSFSVLALTGSLRKDFIKSVCVNNTVTILNVLVRLLNDADDDVASRENIQSLLASAADYGYSTNQVLSLASSSKFNHKTPLLLACKEALSTNDYAAVLAFAKSTSDNRSLVVDVFDSADFSDNERIELTIDCCNRVSHANWLYLVSKQNATPSVSLAKLHHVMDSQGPEMINFFKKYLKAYAISDILTEFRDHRILGNYISPLPSSEKFGSQPVGNAAMIWFLLFNDSADDIRQIKGNALPEQLLTWTKAVVAYDYVNDTIIEREELQLVFKSKFVKEAFGLTDDELKAALVIAGFNIL